jgi:hypothetical protein
MRIAAYVFCEELTRSWLWQRPHQCLNMGEEVERSTAIDDDRSSIDISRTYVHS